jgi:hypothetical protein
VKTSAFLWCILTALIIGFLVVLYANNPHPLTAGAVVYCALMFTVQVVNGIRRTT